MKLSRSLARLAVATTIAAGPVLAITDHAAAGSVTSALAPMAATSTAPRAALLPANPDLPAGCMWTFDLYMIIVYGAAGWCADGRGVIWFDWYGNYWHG